MKLISLLESKDLIKIINIDKHSNISPWNKEVFLKNQGKNFLNLKIYNNEQIIGFVITSIVLDEASLLNIAIDPIYRNYGYAYKLLKFLIKILKKRKILKLWLEVRESNYIAIKLYKKLNFHQITNRLKYYSTLNGRENAIIMVLII